MSGVNRREFVSMAAAAGGLAAVTQPAGPGKPSVDFAVDGAPHTPAEYSALLSRLADSGGIGVDEYSRGGTVEKLEARFASLLGKETAVFMPSGTLANQLALRTLCGPKRRAIVQEISHLYNDSGDCAQELSQLTLMPLAAGRATFTWDEVARVLERSATARVAMPVGAISIESPVRRLHGETFDFGEMQRISAEARKQGIRLHLDGARLFVACAYSGRGPAEYAALFDTVYVSLWKCFSAAGGAVLAGPRADLADLYHVRRMFGGALWGAWPYAAVALHYSEGYLDRLTSAVRVGRELLKILSADARFSVERVPNGTSFFRLTPKTADLPAYRERLSMRGITVPPPEAGGFWLRINETLRGAAPEAIADVFRSALS